MYEDSTRIRIKVRYVPVLYVLVILVLSLLVLTAERLNGLNGNIGL